MFEKVFEIIDQHREEITNLVRELVRIPSVTGFEGKAQLLVENKMRQIGLETDVFEASFDEVRKHPAYVPSSIVDEGGYEERPNVVGNLVSHGGGKSLILASHIDTVAPGLREFWKHEPFGGEIEEGKVFGRGSADGKGGLVQAIFAVNSILEAGIKPKGDLSIISSIGEEDGGSGGMLACVLRGYQADGAIYAHPIFGIDRIVIATGGFLTFGVKVKGRRTHAYEAHRGVNAIDKAMKVLYCLDKLDALRGETKKYPLFDRFFGRSTNLFASAISGGKVPSGSWIPDECELKFGVVFSSQETGNEVKEQVERKLQSLSVSDSWFKQYPPEIKWFSYIRPCETDPTDIFVRCLSECVKKTVGKRPDPMGVPSFSDMRFLSLYTKTPVVMFGGSGGNIHGTDEWVDVDTLIESTKATALTILRWCGCK